MTRKVNWVSIILGVVGWTLIGLTVLAMWLALRASASDPDPSGKDIIGFFPLFAMIFIGPVNLAGGIIGIVGATGTPKVRKLNWLGILLNASPYVMFVVLMFALMLSAQVAEARLSPCVQQCLWVHARRRGTREGVRLRWNFRDDQLMEERL